MAKINLPPKKEKSYERIQTPMRELRAKAYRSKAWRKLRLKYIMEHPMCERCHHKPAEDIHHIRSFIVNGEINHYLLTAEDNLKALCKECHNHEHTKHKTTRDILNELDALLNNTDEY